MLVVPFKRRTLVVGAAAAMLPAWAPAQSFPSKPIRIVVPFGPGGIADLTVRAIASKLGENLRQAWWWRTSPARAAWWPATWWPSRKPTAMCCCS